MSLSLGNNMIQHGPPVVDADTEERLLVLWAQLRSELVPLIQSRSNFKVTINMSGGGPGKLEIVKYVNV